MKNINFEDGEFIADGRKFFITETLSIDRFMEYEKLQTSMAFNLSFKQVFDSLNDIYKLINSVKLADASIKIYNLMNGLAERVDSKLHPALEICSLFILEEGEDPSKYDEAISKSKIQAWRKEGYAMQDFFSLAVSLVEGFMESYRDFTESISKLVIQAQEENSTMTQE